MSTAFQVQNSLQFSVKDRWDNGEISLFMTTAISLSCRQGCPLFPARIERNQVHTYLLTLSFFKRNCHSRLGLRSFLLPSWLRSNRCTHFLSFVASQYVILYSLMILVIFGEEYKLRNFALCRFCLVLLLPLSDQNIPPAPASFP
jgi:hypothetical protein